MLSKRSIRKKLVSIGSRVDESFCVYVNNDDPKYFSCHDDAISYLQNYRENNVIFKLQLFRIETYSL